MEAQSLNRWTTNKVLLFHTLEWLISEITNIGKVLAWDLILQGTLAGPSLWLSKGKSLPGSLHWENGVLVTRNFPPGKSLTLALICIFPMINDVQHLSVIHLSSLGNVYSVPLFVCFFFLARVETVALTRWTFVGKVMCLLFNRPSRLVITFLPRSQGYGFSSGHVWMWELDCEESWVLKNWCFWTVVLEKTLESPLDCKEIQPVHPKGDQSWVFIGRTDAEAETPLLWPPDAKSWLIGKDPDPGEDWGQEEKGTTEDEMAG